MDAILAADALLEQLESVQLASVTDEGYPRACEMQLREHDGLKWFTFITRCGSQKALHFLANPKAGVSFCVGDDCASLIGAVELLAEEPRPGYCVLRFTTLGGKLFLDGVFSEFSYE